jgi:alkylation response protein AidB-like acyl-CoA dehydrogenase
VRFALSDEQLALRSVARDVCADVGSLPRLRDVWEGRAAVADVRRKLADSSLTGIGAPEGDGGVGGDELDAAVVLEEAGRACLPEPLVETLGLVLPLLREHAPPELRRRWSSAVAAGERAIAVGVGPEPFVVAGSGADAFLLEVDGALHLVPADQVTTRAVRSEDPTRDLVAIEAVRISEGSLLVGADPQRAWLRGAAATAAASVGLAARLLELTVAHASSRQQFDQPIGAFQAVQHPLASVHVAVEAARNAAWYAAHARAVDLPDADDAARVAKVAADEASALADRVALQVHGGIGFTWEHDLHLLLKRAAAWRAAYGDARTHRAALASTLLSRTAPGAHREGDGG